jgi:hypothetical protein
MGRSRHDVFDIPAEPPKQCENKKELRGLDAAAGLGRPGERLQVRLRQHRQRDLAEGQPLQVSLLVREHGVEQISQRARTSGEGLGELRPQQGQLLAITSATAPLLGVIDISTSQARSLIRPTMISASPTEETGRLIPGGSGVGDPQQPKS